MKKAISILFLFIGFWSIADAQSTLKDSLMNKLAIANQDTSRVLIMSRLCSYYSSINVDSSLIYGRQALNLAQKIKFSKGEMMSLRRLGYTTWLIGDNPEALELIFKGLRIAEENHSSYETAVCLQGIGEIYSFGLNDNKKALEYYYRTMNLLESLNPNTQMTNLINGTNMRIGIAYLQISQYDSAMIYMQKAKNNSSANSTNYSVTMMFMGKLQFQTGNRQLAMEYLQKSIQLHIQNNQSRGISEAYNIYAGFFKEIDQHDSTIYYAKKAFAVAQSISFKKEMSVSCNLLANEYELTDITEAYKYIKIAQTLNEELYGAKKVQSLQKLITEEQERQRKIEAENLAYQNRLRLNSFLGITFTLMVIAMFLFVISRRNKKAKLKIESAFNQLKATQSQLIQSEKMASLGELTAGIAHEIQNPLNFVNNFSEVNTELIDEADQEIDKGNISEVKTILKDIKENEQKINHHGKRADAIVKGMLQHSQTSSGQKELTDINKLADEYLRLAYHGLKAKDKSFNADFKTEFDETLPKINVIPQDIGRVLLNLINNAFYAVDNKAKTIDPLTPKGGTKNDQSEYRPTVTISTASFIPPLGGTRWVRLVVKDNGGGIPPEIIDKIFQPFFTTKPTGQGTGLGLSLSYDIVKAHGGELKVETPPARRAGKEGEWAEFIIQLPVN